MGDVARSDGNGDDGDVVFVGMGVLTEGVTPSVGGVFFAVAEVPGDNLPGPARDAVVCSCCEGVAVEFVLAEARADVPTVPTGSGVVLVAVVEP